MHYRIDNSSPRTPSQQLEEQVRFGVAAGRLKPGERLPSVRALAAEVRVNPNTVGRAWRELEREGVLEMRRGEGAFVAAEAALRCRSAVEKVIAERVHRTVQEALEAGIETERIQKLVRAALEGESTDQQLEKRKAS